MGLSERLAAGIPVRNARFEYALEQLLPAEKQALITAALDPNWSDYELVRILQDEGLIVGVEAFTSWRAVLRAAGVPPVPLPLPPDWVPPVVSRDQP